MIGEGYEYFQGYGPRTLEVAQLFAFPDIFWVLYLPAWEYLLVLVALPWRMMNSLVHL